MKMKTILSFSFLGAGLAALLFSSAAIAQYEDDYLKTISLQTVDFDKTVSEDQREQMLEDLSWVHFSMLNALPKRATLSEIDRFAKTHDAQSVLEKSSFTREAWLRLSEHKDFMRLLEKLEGDGVLSIEDAIVFSQSAAKVVY